MCSAGWDPGREKETLLQIVLGLRFGNQLARVAEKSRVGLLVVRPSLKTGDETYRLTVRLPTTTMDALNAAAAAYEVMWKERSAPGIMARSLIEGMLKQMGFLEE